MLQNIAIHGRKLNPQAIPFIEELLRSLLDKGAKVCLSEILVTNNIDWISKYNFPTYVVYDHVAQFDLFISIGGDGTFLETLTHVGKHEIPILGVNTGRLGFLASTSKEQIGKAMDSLFKGNFVEDKRSLLYLESNSSLFDGINFALNEFSIVRKETSSMIVIKTFLDGEFLNTYWADGLMVATPTGSTGYSLSCGGPILLPHTNNFVITPVSPHNLNIRPLIVSDASELTFEVESRNSNFLVTLDSRSQAAEESMFLKLKKAPFRANIIKMEGVNFIETLRSKLSWGLDRRN
ncbi:MAG: NAD kinase [Cyclobacteriaceae bacterium]